MWVLNKSPSYLMHYGVKGMTWDESKRVHDDLYYETLGTAKSQTESAKSRTAVIGKFSPKSSKSKNLKSKIEEQQAEESAAKVPKKKEKTESWWESQHWVKVARGQIDNASEKVAEKKLSNTAVVKATTVGKTEIEKLRRK